MFLDIRSMTICVVDQHFSLNKILLRALALWPYHRTKLVELHLVLLFFIFISFILVQLTTFLTTECTPNMRIRIFSFVLYFTIYLIKYSCFCINSDTIRCLLDKFQYICDELKDEGEIAIIKEYGNEAKRFTLIMSVYSISNALILCLLPIVPRILGIFTSINVSEEYFMIHVPREYFIDQEKYYYYILLHMEANFFIGAIVLLATGTMLFGCIKYICGLFRIASCRIDQTMETSMFQSAGLSKDCVIYKKIVHAIDIYRKAVELVLIISAQLCDIIKSNLVGSCFSLMLVGVISLSLNLYGLHQALMLVSATEECLMYVTLTVVILIYMFIASYIGQEVSDHHNHVFISVYNIKWYVTPLYIQRIILFLLQKGTKNFYITFGGQFVMSMESATTVKLCHIMSCYKITSNYNFPRGVTLSA
ncbi:uncharacterized protein LOC105284145 isoform X1 [Ooceraea biroi]|uniref:uncharacterized protein LOC105284145 isoform X1 n=1 Tax=Ooceraea biroi TaxID=2015173 RepID=UPI000F07D63B|nr:uncharacterized protein LOC105284145 isoform X1 [Ooceraea biroi]